MYSSDMCMTVNWIECRFYFQYFLLLLLFVCFLLLLLLLFVCWRKTAGIFLNCSTILININRFNLYFVSKNSFFAFSIFSFIASVILIFCSIQSQFLLNILCFFFYLMITIWNFVRYSVLFYFFLLAFYLFLFCFMSNINLKWIFIWMKVLQVPCVLKMIQTNSRSFINLMSKCYIKMIS